MALGAKGSNSCDDTPAIVVFASLDELLADQPDNASQLLRPAVAMLADWDVRLILVSVCAASHVRQLQHQLNVAHPFVCAGGAAVYVPRTYFEPADVQRVAEGAWEVFRFNPPDRIAAVNLVRDLFLAGCCSDVLTIGIGSNLDDYGVLATVDVPVVVRDPLKNQRELLRYVPAAYLTDATGIDGWSEALIGPSPA
jgi:hypothetical protein